MGFTDTQTRQLSAKLDAKHVRTRNANGAVLHYVEGWHVVDEANRIFGFDAWDRRTLINTCIWSGTSGECFVAAYTAKVRISVRAGDITVVRDGSGSGEGKALTRTEAHELALKSAETDATKRALATFGNPFGLALYDREQSGVRKSRKAEIPQTSGPWALRNSSGATETTFDKPSQFADALRRTMSEASSIEMLFSIWEQNVEAVRSLSRALKQDRLPKSGIAPQLVAHLKRCAVELAAPRVENPQSRSNGAARTKIDKSTLPIGEPRRIRCREHLRFVASQPCVICGRSPCHAHHVRHAQSRGLGLKVSDEFTVPLCAIHHHEVHRTGKEREWWQQRNIDPLEVAGALWRESRPPLPSTATADEPTPSTQEPSQSEGLQSQ